MLDNLRFILGSVPNPVATTVVLVIFLVALYKRFQYFRLCSKVPGPPAQIPLFGSLTDVLLKPEELIGFVKNLIQKYGKSANNVLRIWVGPMPVFVISSATSAKTLLSSNELIEKSREYNFLHPWLNQGLLTSKGKKWQTRRKMLTSAFHFKILEDSINIFNEQSSILVEKLRAAAAATSDFNVYPYITRCSLDIICESAMGHDVDAQNNNNSEYVRSVYRMSEIVQRRQLEPWLQLHWIFNLTAMGADQRKCLKVLHDFTDQVIQAKKLEFAKRKAEQELEGNLEGDYTLSKKRRLAFLDLLIENSDNGKNLSDADIREEVDTFMFEGHDTTAAAIAWTLFLVGSHPEVQEQIHEELAQVFGDSDRPVTMSDLNELKYLECCIKESLRLYPSVPVMGRKISEDTIFDGYEIPSGTTVILVTPLLHRDSTNFSEPERFIPERFLPENCHGRHPYAYVPFSAGPRNCIGQKFAAMEEKVVLASVFRNFQIESLDQVENMAIVSQLILRPRDGVRLRVKPRN